MPSLLVCYYAVIERIESNWKERTAMTLKRLMILMLLSAMLAGGCGGKDNMYSGIEQQDLTEIKTAKELDYIYAYKGHTGNWASTYYVYQKKDSDSHVSKFFLKYIGKEPAQ